MTGSILHPRNAMVLAAGLGLRLRPITDMIPKPLVPVAGRTMLDRVLDALDAVGVSSCVVNTHYLGHLIAAHLERRERPAIHVSPEIELLDTGGGVAKVLPRLGSAPFYTVNADILWEEGPGAPALSRLAEALDDEMMDGLLLVVPLGRAVGYDGKGDFNLDAEGRLLRRGVAPAADYVFTGVQILHPRLFAGHPDGAFSLNRLYDKAIAERRLHGLVHVGRWFHIGTVEGLYLAEAGLAPSPRVPP